MRTRLSLLVLLVPLLAGCESDPVSPAPVRADAELPAFLSAEAVETLPLRCDSAQAWAQAHASAMPRTLPAFERLPLVYRRATFARMTPSVKRDLWAAHLGQFLRPEAGLTPAQRDTLRRLRAELSPAFFAPGAPAPYSRERLTAAFGQRALDIFTVLGKASPMPRIAPDAEMTFQVLPNCSCSVDDDWCNMSQFDLRSKCVYPEGCTGQMSGCGYYWTRTCSGTCTRPTEPILG